LPGAPPASRKGTIFKQGHMVKNWKNRFFVLENGIMAYYETSSPRPPFGVNKKGEISLKGCTVSMDKSIVTISSSQSANDKGHKELVLDIKYPNERQEWMESITEHIAFYSK
ncbi:hypothetical protein EON65_18710, partial [archaeon]